MRRRPNVSDMPFPPKTAVALAAQRPDLVRGLVLLNATPFWTTRPPLAKSGGFWRLLSSLDGSVPAPPNVLALLKRFGIWEALRHPANVRCSNVVCCCS